jgi:guanylate kinase
MAATPGITFVPAATPLLVVISAPSGAGKTTIVRELLEARRDSTRVVTCTTRPPRPGENDGADYHFLDRGEFEARIAGGAFLEWAEVYGNLYGTLRQEVLSALSTGCHVLLTVDVQGAASIKAQAREDQVLRRSLVTVFVTVPSLASLEARLRGRGHDAEGVMQRRLAEARAEMDRWREFDYVLVSGTREQDQQRMRAILDAESMRSTRRPEAKE